MHDPRDMRTATVLLATLAAATALAGCSSSPSPGDGDGAPAGSENGFGAASSSTGGLGASSGSTGGTNTDGCAEEAKQVYVLSAQFDLYRFEPDRLEFTKIGRLRCPGTSSPNSMAVDRQGNAWVNYQDGSLFKVSTKDASCDETTFAAGQSGIVKFGMAFATTGPDSKEETLFVSGIEDSTFNDGGKGLATIDLETMKLTRISDYDGALAKKGAELTGTGDGRLFGFFTTFPDATLARIAKESAATSERRALDGVSTGTAWAFSFWGGDFWFYTSLGGPSSVTRLRTETGELGIALPDVGGFRIVGAGVSTCAPLTSGPR